MFQLHYPVICETVDDFHVERSWLPQKSLNPVAQGLDYEKWIFKHHSINQQIQETGINEPLLKLPIDLFFKDHLSTIVM